MLSRRSALALLTALAVAAAAWGGWLFYERRQPAPIALSADEQSALAAGRQFIVNVYSYAAATFDSDFQRALAGTTGGLTAQVQSTEQAVQASLATGTVIATSAQVRSAAVSSTKGSQ